MPIKKRGRKKDYSFLSEFIGEKLAKKVKNANILLATIARKGEVKHFNFFEGENTEGKKVVLVEFVN